MADYRDAIAQRLAPLINKLNQSAYKAEAERAKADPKAHKLSKVFDSTNYRYLVAGKDGRGRTVYFCWSSHRNAAGYFLGWREVRNRKREGKRDQWAARKVKKRLKELAERRVDRFREKRVLAEFGRATQL